MAQTSTTILASQDHISNITGTDITFSATGSEYKITADTTSLGNIDPYDLITVTGTSLNDSTFTVKSRASDNMSIIVEEIVANETKGASFTLDHTGFVSAKVKGDGYYSQVDGVHTVAYQVTNVLTGSIKMQGTLASTPTESDWFDIAGTTFTTDQSTLISSANFTGNFVFVRAKATLVTDGAISSILLNS